MSNHNDIHDESMKPIDDAAKKAGKKAGRKASRKAAKMALKASKKALLWIIKLLGAKVALIIGLILIAIITFNSVMNFIGINKQYAPEYENDYTENEEGTLITTEELMNAESKIVRDFYIYHAGISYHQIVGENNEELLRAGEDGTLNDYYNSSSIFRLNPDLLFALDKYMFEDEFKYPEQFIKPVYYDPETLTLKSLTDENGVVVAESEEIDVETGEKTGETINSVRDYGLGSVLKFNLTEKWEKIVAMKGVYDRREVWDDYSKRVIVVDMDTPEEFYTEIKREKIDLVEKVITFAGEASFEYEYQENKVSSLLQGMSTDSSSAYDKVLYDTYKHVECYYVKDEDGNQRYDEHGRPIQECSDPVSYNLYKYRSSDSGIFEKIPTQVAVHTVDKGTSYLEDYMHNFESYIPKNVVTNFNFAERVDYQNLSGSYHAFLGGEYKLPLGESLDKPKFKKAKEYLPIIVKHADEFGVDPLVILAMLTQESGGDNNINANGLMQITSSSDEVSMSAVNARGENVTVTVNREQRQDPDIAIRYATAYHKKLLDDYEGNVLKAIQGYNLGPGTMSYIQRTYPEAWGDEYAWMLYREEARQQYATPNSPSASYREGVLFLVNGRTFYPERAGFSGPSWGDSSYLENVLQYYAGSNIESVAEHSGGWSEYTAPPDYYEEFIVDDPGELGWIDYKEKVHMDTPEMVLLSASAMENQDYVTNEDSFSNLSFWDKGFLQAIGSIGMNIDDIHSLTGYYDGYAPPIIIGPGIVVTSKFGTRVHPITGAVHHHPGIDVAAPQGTPLYAIADGIVEDARFNGGYGNYIKLSHGNGVESRYAHLHSYAVSKGDVVTKGQVIGFVGTTGNSTGNHLHFELHINGVAIDPLSLIQGSVAEAALEEALKYLGVPYVWGGTTPRGFDCSGIVQYAYRKVGYPNMPRTTFQQYLVGTGIQQSNVKRGDLIFFNNGNTPGSPPDHVAIYIGKDSNGVDHMLHAPRPGKNVEIRSVYWETMHSIRRP